MSDLSPYAIDVAGVVRDLLLTLAQDLGDRPAANHVAGVVESCAASMESVARQFRPNVQGTELEGLPIRVVMPGDDQDAYYVDGCVAALRYIAWQAHAVANDAGDPRAQALLQIAKVLPHEGVALHVGGGE